MYLSPCVFITVPEEHEVAVDGGRSRAPVGGVRGGLRNVCGPSGARGMIGVRALIRGMALVCLVLLVVPAPEVHAQAVPLDQYTGRSPVLIVYSRSRDDDRPFAFNLELSMQWNRITARSIQVLDVDAASYDVDAVARQFGLGDAGFAAIMIAVDGSVVSVETEPGTLDDILREFDLYVSRSGMLRPHRQPSSSERQL